MNQSARTARQTRFLNVDLDIYSRQNLRPLVAALGKSVYPLHVGREGRLWSAHLELSEAPRDADAAIRKFSALILLLPKKPREFWDSAETRNFNIGIQAGSKGKAREFKLSPRAMREASSVTARVVVTVYPSSFA